MVLNFDNSDSRRAVEHCFRTTSTMINPILDWAEEDVWDFLHHYGCQSNPLYQCGFSRIGCIGCPLAGAKHQKEEFKQHPKYYEAYIRTFEKMVKALEEKGNKKNFSWTDGEAVMHWWLKDERIDNGQLNFDGFDILDL